MKRAILTVVVLLVCAAPAFAQTPVLGTERLTWDQPAATLAVAQAFEYRVYIDAAATGTVVAASCAGTASPFVCSTPFPAATPGVHNTPGIQVTATSISGTVRAESLKSTALPFVLVVAPLAPTNVRVQ